MAMNHFHAGTLLLLGVTAMTTVPACGGGPPSSRSTGASGSAGQYSGSGISGDPVLNVGSHSNGSTGSGSSNSTGTGSSGTGSASNGTGNHGTGSASNGTGSSGTGSASNGTGNQGTGSDETGGPDDEGGFGGASGNGASGSNETYDYGNLGVGGTMDTGGVGGSLDVGAGGSLDMGTGGSLDLGTGGTIDTCAPTCTPDLLGVGEKAVNLVVFDNAKAGGCDTEGRMWVGGNASLDGYGVGAQLKTCDAKDPVLVVGGNLDVSGGINGSIWVGGDFSGGRPKCGNILSDKPSPVDFPFIQAQLTAYSKLLASYPVNGTASLKYGTVTFQGTDKEINIFTVDAQDIANATGLEFDVPKTATVIINVTGTTVSFSGGTAKLPDGVSCGSGSVKLNDFCNQIVWNLASATAVNVNGTAVQGTLLAPHATLNGGGANVNGTVIVKELALDGCVEMHPHYFNGCLCTEEVNSKYACCPK